MCSIKEDNLPLLWYLENVNHIKNSVGIKRTRNQQSIKWVFCEIFRTHNHTLRLVSPWGRPGHTLLPNTLHTLPPREATLVPNAIHSTQHTLQEAALRPRDFRRPPYSPETAPTVSPAYPAYPSFRQSIPMVPSIHSLQEKPQGPHRLQDYKTANIASQQRA